MQYPHFLYRLKHENSIQDAKGNWSKTTDEWIFVCMCREEANGKGERTILPDGKDFLFHSLIQIPVGNSKIPEGTEIIIGSKEINSDDLKDNRKIEQYKGDGTIRIKGLCMKYDTNRFHNRMWM